MLLRLINVGIGAVIITAALFYMMSVLIATGENPLTEDTVGRIVDFVRVKQEETVQRKDRKPEKPEKPQAPPPVQPRPQLDPLKVDAKIDTGYNLNPQVSLDKFGLEAGEGDYLPIVKVQPEYPRRALSRGIEGYVVLEFTVTEAGTVRDIRVIEAQPPGYFERAAIKAAEKFRYKPRVINGKPVPVAGVRNIIRFNLAKEG
ncbi:MAG: protein TonB [Gammaproteobacteria bacterium]|nr:MAG: protein TonB [Gammaproteobacteria bacterium]